MSRNFCIAALAFLFCFACNVAAQTAPAQLKPEALAGMSFRGIGPAIMSGRISDIAIHPKHRSTWYVAVSSGGVWKTVNSGTTWTTVFDKESSFSIGCVSIDPGNPDVVWVGTGENVSGRHVGYGDGVYKSLDGGQTWTNMGLAKSEHISRIVVDPRDSKVVYVAAEGPLWSAGGDRGVYKTTDGGKTWKQVLRISDNTGAASLELDPRNPEVLYAAAYQRRRHIWALLAGGPESGIYKTTDGGASWRRIQNGLPKGDMGKIGLAVSPVNPDIVYATIEASEKERGFYRSADSGESWEKRSSYLSDGTGPHYYQEIYASPHKLDLVYQMDVWIHVSDDGGKTFRLLGEPAKHSDNHALAFDRHDPDYLVAGCDGGLYESFDQGRSWKFAANLPVTQIYKMALDNDYPFYNMVAGTQDNGTIYGPSRTGSEHGIQNRDWLVPYGADGYSCQIDPKDPRILYVSWQGGNLLRYDRQSRELVNIKPQPGPKDAPERWNWDSPILVSPHSNTRLYYGSQRLWRSDDRGDSWKPVSGDLTRNQNRYELKMIGRVWSVDALYDNGAMSWYDNITSISEAPVKEGLIYVGTDDGLIQVTENSGSSWRKISSFPGVPETAFVNKIQASLNDPNTVVALFDNHKVGDFNPYIMKSTDRGQTWTSMAGDLPDRHVLWSIVQDHVNPDLYFLGTEFAVFMTIDSGAHWVRLQGGLPTIAFMDLQIQHRDNDLVAASFGRGFYVLDDYSPLRLITPQSLQQDRLLFPVRNALRFVPSVDLGERGKGYQGDAYYAAPNPPFGAMVTYYLKESMQTAKEIRREKEKEIEKQGGDVLFPGWEALHKEARETQPKLLLTISDAKGNVVRTLEASSAAGIHRIAWDLRYPAANPTQIEERAPEPFDLPPAGPLAPPGRYSAQLAMLTENGIKTLTPPQSFEVIDWKNLSLPAPSQDAVTDFDRNASLLLRKVLNMNAEVQDVAHRMPYIRKTLLEAGAGNALLERGRLIESRVVEIRDRLTGDPVRAKLNEPTVPSVMDRVQEITGGLRDSRSGPTQTDRASLETAAQQFQALAGTWRTIVQDLRKLEADMDAAGMPSTPGRIVQ